MCDAFDGSKYMKYLKLLTDNGDGLLFLSAPIFDCVFVLPFYE